MVPAMMQPCSRARIYRGDCLEILPRIQTKVDAVITDLPYGTTDCSWDQALDLSAWWRCVKPLLHEHSVVVLFAASRFMYDLYASNRAWYRYDLVWEKPRAVGFLNAKNRPLRAHENILVFVERFGGSTYNPQMTPARKKQGRIVRHAPTAIYSKQQAGMTWVDTGRRYPRSVILVGEQSRKGGHPTAKPVALMDWLVRTYTNAGDVVLDTCMGGGSTGVACVAAGRQFVGVEQDPHWFNVSANRISAAAKVGPRLHCRAA